MKMMNYSCNRLEQINDILLNTLINTNPITYNGNCATENRETFRNGSKYLNMQRRLLRNLNVCRLSVNIYAATI